MSKIGVGIQLYSVRKAAAADLPAVLKGVKAMGYEAVEFAGYYGRTAYELKKLLDENGLKCCGTHNGIDAFQGDNFRKTVDFHKIIGCEYPIVAWINDDMRKSVAALGASAKLFNEIAEKLKPFGMKTGYHAHGGDFAKMNGGRTQWEILFGSTCSDVVMQMDCGNCMQGGGDPLALMKQLPGRSESVHLKEFGGPHGAVVGEGKVDWKGIFEFCSTIGGTKWYVVEHEVEGIDSMEAIAKFREGLRKFGI